jgi:glycosyltransferase involved in cell wall biosynthesis
VKLKSSTLIYISPAVGTGGVGDYADDFIAALESEFSRVVHVQTGGPGRDSIRSIRSARASVREIIRSSENPLLHAELSAASIGPFWAAGQKWGVPYSGTVHDPPHLTWWPLRTRLVSQSRYATHALHFPFRKPMWELERQRWQEPVLFSLSRVGREALATTFPKADVHYVPHYIPHRRAAPPLNSRPRAIGFFGHLYGGKGFELVNDIRRQLDPSISMEIAGRGTQILPPMPGVRIWGPVDEPAEQEFFASVRCLLLPYDSNSRYGPFYSASGAAARAFAFGTPTISTPSRAFVEDADEGVCVIAENGPTSLARSAAELVNDVTALHAVSVELSRLRSKRSIANVASSFLRVWEAM